MRRAGKSYFRDLSASPHAYPLGDCRAITQLVQFEDLVRVLIYDYKDWQSIEATARVDTTQFSFP